MARLISLALLIAPVLTAAQSPDPLSGQKIAEELRAVRSSLEKIERSQSVLIVLSRIQIDESRVSVLEARRLQLLSQEQPLEKQVLESSSSLPREQSGSQSAVVQISPDGSPQVVQAPSGSSAAERFTEASGKLEEVRRTRLAIEQSIAGFRKRIAVWEKQVEETLR
jgi:hypothetical protein